MSACLTHDLVQVYPTMHAAILRVNLDGIDARVFALFWPGGVSGHRDRDRIEVWSKHLSQELLTRIEFALDEHQVMADIRAAVDELCAKEEPIK